MAIQASEALSRFLTQVNSIQKTIEIRDKLVQFGSQRPRGLSPTASELRHLVRQLGQSGMQPSLDGAVLLLAAAFEQFVWDVMVEYTADLPSIFPVYEDLPKSVRSANERLTGEALDRNRSRFTDYELQRFVENLRGCHAGSAPYLLNGEAIALNNRNLNARRLRELFSRLGVNDIWSVTGRTSTLKYWSGRGGAKVAISRAQSELGKLIQDRNQIAHRVGSIRVGSEGVRSYIIFERALANSLAKGLDDYAGSL